MSFLFDVFEFTFDFNFPKFYSWYRKMQRNAVIKLLNYP